MPKSILGPCLRVPLWGNRKLWFSTKAKPRQLFQNNFPPFLLPLFWVFSPNFRFPELLLTCSIFFLLMMYPQDLVITSPRSPLVWPSHPPEHFPTLDTPVQAPPQTFSMWFHLRPSPPTGCSTWASTTWLVIAVAPVTFPMASHPVSWV